MTKKGSKKDTFEDSMAALESIVEKMESGSVALEDTVEQFESGMKLVKECESALNKFQSRIEVVVAENKSELNTEAFEERE
jgi:exodeoxyribonuclease VII small subunit